MKMSETVLKSKYIKALDLGGKPVLYTIKLVTPVTMGLPGEQEEKIVVYFEEETRGLVLNKTNAVTLVDLFGDDSDAWAGEQVVLFGDRAAYMGKTHDVIRIRKPKAASGGAAPPPPPTQEALADEVPF